MTGRLRSFFKDVGSVLDISPSTDFFELVPKESPDQRMHRFFADALEQVREATVVYSYDQAPRLVCLRKGGNPEGELNGPDYLQALKVTYSLAADAEPETLFAHPMPAALISKRGARLGKTQQQKH